MPAKALTVLVKILLIYVVNIRFNTLWQKAPFSRCFFASAELRGLSSFAVLGIIYSAEQLLKLMFRHSLYLERTDHLG